MPSESRRPPQPLMQPQTRGDWEEAIQSSSKAFSFGFPNINCTLHESLTFLYTLRITCQISRSVMLFANSLKMQQFERNRNTTHLGSLIGIFYFGYYTVWKFSNFPGTLTLREIDFGWFQKIKKFRLNIEQNLWGF